MAGSYPGEYKTQKVSLSPYELAKLERRVRSRIENREPMAVIMRSTGLSITRIRAIAAKFGLEIAKGVGGRRL